jgi:hypothetical protein
VTTPTPPPEGENPFAGSGDNAVPAAPEGLPAPPPPAAQPPVPPPPAAYPPAVPAPGAPPPPAYGAPAGYAGAAPQNSQGTIALVTGILGLLCCGILSIVAIITGRKGVALADQGLATNRGSAQAGMILGWIGVALWVVGVVVWAIALASRGGSA